MKRLRDSLDPNGLVAGAAPIHSTRACMTQIHAKKALQSLTLSLGLWAALLVTVLQELQHRTSNLCDTFSCRSLHLLLPSRVSWMIFGMT